MFSGLLFVVDSSDKARISEAAEELHAILDDPEMDRNAPVPVIANKQDLPWAMSPGELIDSLQRYSQSHRRHGSRLFHWFAWYNS